MGLLKSIREWFASAFKDGCTGDCNQGRNCTCQTTDQISG